MSDRAERAPGFSHELDRLIPEVVRGASDTYTAPAHGWTCFHCGETFTTVGAARDHFGADQMAEPGCMLKVAPGEERGLLMALRKAEAEIAKLRAANEQLDYEAGHAAAMTAELGRYFNGARSAHQAFLAYDAMTGRALAAEERLATMRNGLTADDLIKLDIWLKWTEEGREPAAMGAEIASIASNVRRMLALIGVRP